MALKSLLNVPHPSVKLTRWGLTIQELDLYIHYRLGKTNQAADALSRNPCEIQTGLYTDHTVLHTKDGEGLINQVGMEKGTSLSTG